MKKLLYLLALLLPFGLPILVVVYLVRDRQTWRVTYTQNLAALVWSRDITLRTAVHALRTWPLAVASRKGAYIVDQAGVEMGARLCH